MKLPVANEKDKFSVFSVLSVAKKSTGNFVTNRLTFDNISPVAGFRRSS